jgi:hypothetical protein
MSDNPMDKLPAFNRVSVRAVLVSDGENPSAALADAGFADPVALPVVLGEELDLSGGILGDGITLNLTGVLETETRETSDSGPGARSGTVVSASDDARSSGPVTTTLPAAFGMQPLAPVRTVS